MEVELPLLRAPDSPVLLRKSVTQEEDWYDYRVEKEEWAFTYDGDNILMMCSY
jgi:hypothetical protein